MKKKYIYYLILVFSLLFSIIKNTTVEAASAKETKVAYHNFLSKHEKKYKYFKVLPIGTKKELILLVAENLIDKKYSTYVDIYYYDGKKVKPVREKSIGTPGTAYYISYTKGHLFIPHRWGGGTRIQVKGANTVGDSCVYNVLLDVSVTQTYKNGEYYNRKEVSRDAYLSFEKKWQGKPINSVKNNSKNRKKYVPKNPFIQLSDSAISLYNKQTKQLRVSLYPTNKKIKWTSSNKKVAIVNSKGKVTAKKTGTVIITAKANGIKAKCKVTVKKQPQYNIYGTWVIDSDYTNKKNKLSLFDLFGTGLKYGDEMTITKDKKFSYYIGIGNGGKGKFLYKDNKIKYKITQYEGGASESGTMSVKKVGSKLYVVMNYGSEKLYWTKK